MCLGYVLSINRSFLDRLENTTSRLPIFETGTEESFSINNEMSWIFLWPLVRISFSWYEIVTTYSFHICFLVFAKFLRDACNATICRYTQEFTKDLKKIKLTNLDGHCHWYQETQQHHCIELVFSEKTFFPTFLTTSFAL